MTVDELRPKSAVKQFTNRDEEEEEGIAGLLPTETLQKNWGPSFRQTWRTCRPRSREDIMLDTRKSDGFRQAFGYSYLGSVTYDGSLITLFFAETQVEISGRNLDRLYDALCQHRVPFVQEGNEQEEAIKPADEPHIQHIEVMNGAEEARGTEETIR